MSMENEWRASNPAQAEGRRQRCTCEQETITIPASGPNDIPMLMMGKTRLNMNCPVHFPGSWRERFAHLYEWGTESTRLEGFPTVDPDKVQDVIGYIPQGTFGAAAQLQTAAYSQENKAESAFLMPAHFGRTILVYPSANLFKSEVKRLRQMGRYVPAFSRKGKTVSFERPFRRVPLTLIYVSAFAIEKTNEGWQICRSRWGDGPYGELFTGLECAKMVKKASIRCGAPADVGPVLKPAQIGGDQ